MQWHGRGCSPRGAPTWAGESQRRQRGQSLNMERAPVAAAGARAGRGADGYVIQVEVRRVLPEAELQLGPGCRRHERECVMGIWEAVSIEDLGAVKDGPVDIRFKPVGNASLGG